MWRMLRTICFEKLEMLMLCARQKSTKDWKEKHEQELLSSALPACVPRALAASSSMVKSRQ
jgi:hypothetical protein